MMKRPARKPQIFLTVDLEPDCPPYLNTCRGITEGTVLLLSLLDEENVKATFFVTGQIARDYPDIIRDLIDRGHEAGSHGFSHSDFTTLGRDAAQRDIELSLEVLRPFGPVYSFRSPYLNFPQGYLSLLEKVGLSVDSSQAKYKPSYLQNSRQTTLRRIPASVTSSVLRLPAWLRNRWLGALESPVVLFVHPWEFVDLRKANIPLDCRFKTGGAALRCLREVIQFYKGRDFQFRKMQDVLTEPDKISTNQAAAAIR
ncbi:MAG: polysaccharide deacetylase [Deltaproteobacteria bacterium HGW-Deltaproteobacteria-6]|jgi:peptidoglycan/xylan/chitin deacetylase (PgdA/CDA1 family)|nr:MAG: polysaccharide deacetylase [Deltaproteobacteria bacterium HGW-Deltaproteobacteria-6]